MEIPAFKLALVGNGDVGKTVECFNQVYRQTRGIREYFIQFNTSRGPIKFIVAHTPRHEKYISNSCEIQCAMLLFDNNLSYNGLDRWYYKLDANIPMVLIENKFDIKKKRFSPQNGLMQYYISAKSAYSLDKPFLYLARKLLDDDTLVFITAS